LHTVPVAALGVLLELRRSRRVRTVDPGVHHVDGVGRGWLDGGGSAVVQVGRR
jgi:hypothetical protein